MTGITNMVMPKIEREAEARNYGKFIISPLERGYGVTLGNALRRVLLSSWRARLSHPSASRMCCMNSATSPACARMSSR